MSIPVTRRGALVAASVFAITGRARAATVIRWSDAMAVSHPEVSLMYKVASDMKEQTGGAVDIQVFPGGQLGSTADTVAAVSLGATQMVSESPGAFSQFVVPFSILEAPYLWRDVAHMRRAMAAPLMDGMINQLIRERDMRMIGSTYYGTRQLTSGSRPVHTVDDMKGFKLRVPEVDIYRAMAEAWGARPTPLNIGELYLALSQGAVDGEENPLPTIQASKFNEVQKYLVLTATHEREQRDYLEVPRRQAAGIVAGLDCHARNGAERCDRQPGEGIGRHLRQGRHDRDQAGHRKLPQAGDRRNAAPV